MSADEQYRAGFEAWARNKKLVVIRATDGDDYLFNETQQRWEVWAAAKREASTEPSAEIDERHEFERVMSQRGDAAEYIGDGMYSTGAVQDQWEVWLARAELAAGLVAPLPPGSVPAPYTVDMARMMLALGHRYLKENAPEHLASGALSDEAKDAVIEAARKLVKCKGRYHSEQNFKALAESVAAIEAQAKAGKAHG